MISSKEIECNPLYHLEQHLRINYNTREVPSLTSSIQRNRIVPPLPPPPHKICPWHIEACLLSDQYVLMYRSFNPHYIDIMITKVFNIFTWLLLFDSIYVYILVYAFGALRSFGYLLGAKRKKKGKNYIRHIQRIYTLILTTHYIRKYAKSPRRM